MLANLAAYPKLVGGIGAASTDRAARFYASVLDAEVVAMSSSEAAEFSKLADTTYRDVNIALANEFARAADAHGIDVTEVIAAANSQPYSHIHQPGIGVGGHCIPVYPHLLLARAPGLRLVETARAVNDGQTGRAIATLGAILGDLAGVPVLVLGVTYREGVKELAYSRALALIDELRAAGADVAAYDPLMEPAEIEALGARPWTWGEPGPFRAVVTQTADRALRRRWTRPGSRRSRPSTTAATASGASRCPRASRTSASASRRRTPAADRRIRPIARGCDQPDRCDRDSPPSAGRDVRRQRRLARHAGCSARPTPWRMPVMTSCSSRGSRPAIPLADRGAIAPSGVRLVRIPRDEDPIARWRDIQQRAGYPWRAREALARGCVRGSCARGRPAGSAQVPRLLATLVALPWIAYRLVSYALLGDRPPRTRTAAASWTTS